MVATTISVIDITVRLDFYFIKRRSFSCFRQFPSRNIRFHTLSWLHLLGPSLGMSYNTGPIIPHNDELWFMIKGQKISTTMLNLFSINCLILPCFCTSGGPTPTWNHIWNQASQVTGLACSQMCYSSPTYREVTSSLIKNHPLEVSLTYWCMYFHRCF